METAIKVFITLVLMVAVAVAISLDPKIGGRQEYERSIVLGQKQGCVTDWVSQGKYCYLIDSEGREYWSRGY